MAIEISIEWYDTDPHTAAARITLEQDGKILFEIDHVDRAFVRAIADGFRSTERAMLWHEARWFSAQRWHGFRLGAPEPPRHLVPKCDAPEIARALCGAFPRRELKWDSVFPLVEEPTSDRGLCRLCWRRYEREGRAA